jgi:flagellar assembly protein FliH
MHSSSRIVFAEDLVGAAPWRPARIVGERPGGRDRRPGEPAGGRPSPTYEDGLRDGLAQGLAQARAQVEDAHRAALGAAAARADALVAALDAELAALRDGVADDLVGLATEIARSAFGAALRLRDDAVVPAVVAALGAIVDGDARPVLRLHPDDAALVGEQLAPLLAARGVQLVPDESIACGGCRVDTARAAVDATVRTRWRRALTAIGRDDDWIEA